MLVFCNIFDPDVCTSFYLNLQNRTTMVYIGAYILAFVTSLSVTFTGFFWTWSQETHQSKVYYPYNRLLVSWRRVILLIRVFHSLYKVGRNGTIGIKGFNNSTKTATCIGAWPDARDYYWFKCQMPNQLS